MPEALDVTAASTDAGKPKEDDARRGLCKGGRRRDARKELAMDPHRGRGDAATKREEDTSTAADVA